MVSGSGGRKSETEMMLTDSLETSALAKPGYVLMLRRAERFGNDNLRNFCLVVCSNEQGLVVNGPELRRLVTMQSAQSSCVNTYFAGALSV